MSVRVRFAPSPTGFLHIGGARTALFNWLFARHEGGEFRLRIENTDTSREVAEAVDQIQGTLAWLGLDVDGDVTFQMDRMGHAQEVARRLVDEDKAYEDEGAIRFRMPDEGVTGWDDLVLGRVEVPSEQLEDLVLLRSDGRPTYNFVSPVEDALDGITHVIRGQDHVSNTPKQLRILEAIDADLPAYAHVPLLNGPDGRKLSKRHGAITVEDFREQGYIPEAFVNFMARPAQSTLWGKVGGYVAPYEAQAKEATMMLYRLVPRHSISRIQFLPEPKPFVNGPAAYVRL